MSDEKAARATVSPRFYTLFHIQVQCVLATPAAALRLRARLTSLRKQVFSLSAPVQPRKERTKMRDPTRHMSQAGSRKKSRGSCTVFSFSTRMYVPIAITASPTS